MAPRRWAPAILSLRWGPAEEALTRYLVEAAARVIAIEVDPQLASALPHRLEYPPNLELVQGDARDIDLASVLGRAEDYKLVANLPYYAASPIIRRFLEAGRLRPSLMVVMVQKEVAQRMVASDGRMSLLSLAIHMHGLPRIVCYAPPSAFHLRPQGVFRRGEDRTPVQPGS